MKRMTFVLSALLLVACTFTFGQSATKTKPGPATFPVVVANLALTGQTTGVPPTAVFTPENNGLFRVSIDMVLTRRRRKNVQAGAWYGLLRWTDVAPEKNLGPYLKVVKIGSQGPGSTLVCSAAAGQPITFQVRGDLHGHSSYDVFLVVEQLADIPNF